MGSSKVGRQEEQVWDERAEEVRLGGDLDDCSETEGRLRDDGERENRVVF